MGEEFSIEHITQDAYMEVRELAEWKIVKYAEEYLERGVNQDMVMFLIESMDGVVAFYKRESEDSVVYDYAIGLRIDRDSYTRG